MTSFGLPISHNTITWPTCTCIKYAHLILDYHKCLAFLHASLIHVGLLQETVRRKSNRRLAL